MVQDIHVIVCLKQVPDPEAPVSGYSIDTSAKRVVPIGIPPVISPFDENALEVALRLREKYGGKVMAISVGHKLSKAVSRKALSAGADELVTVDDEAFAGDRMDGYGTALVLAQAIDKIGPYGLILTGRQASDTNAGVVGLYLAEILRIPAVTLARDIVLEGEALAVERVLPDGHETVETDMPALVTVSSEAGELRPLRMKDIRDAKSKPMQMWKSSDLAPFQPPELQVALEALLKPERQRQCRFIESQSSAEAGERLALRLEEDGII
jgi:electron transfer flavoprotein beta subunit